MSFESVTSIAFAFGLHTLALIGMVVVTLLTLWRLRLRFALNAVPGWWVIPALALVGLGVASYLVFASASETAVCVLNSCADGGSGRFESLLGGVPRGLLSLIGYGAILVAWSGGQFGSEDQAYVASRWLLGLTAVGELFAIGLTIVEPFVLGVSCPWCLVSAVLMTILFWLSAEVRHGMRLIGEVAIRNS